MTVSLVSYSALVYEMPGAPFWSSLHFTMIMVIILMSTSGAVRVILSSLFELKPNLKAKKSPVIFVASVFLCVLTYLIFFFDLAITIKLLDQIYTDWLLVLAFFQVCGVSYIFGLGNGFHLYRSLHPYNTIYAGNFFSIAKSMGHFSSNNIYVEYTWKILLGLLTPVSILTSIIIGWTIENFISFHDLNNNKVNTQSSWITDLVVIIWVAVACAYKWATVEGTELGPG